MTAQVEAIDKRLEELRGELENTQGRETEVYTRIVGYYRSVRNWNKGKKAEYHIRTPFVVDHATVAERIENPVVSEKEQKIVSIEKGAQVETVSENGSYLFFLRNTCPNCPPVKQYVQSMEMAGETLNVDTEEGMEMAQKYNVMSAPTVLFINEQGEELHRAQSVQELKDYMEPLAVAQM